MIKILIAKSKLKNICSGSEHKNKCCGMFSIFSYAVNNVALVIAREIAKATQEIWQLYRHAQVSIEEIDMQKPHSFVW